MSEIKRPGHVRVSNDFVRNSKLSHSAFRLYVFLSSFNPSFPSYEIIKRDTGLSRATVCRCIKELVSLGWVEYNRGNSKGNANLYKIHTTSSKFKPVEANQFKFDTSTSSNSKLEPVQNLNSNNTNVIIPMKKGDLKKIMNSLIKAKNLENV